MVCPRESETVNRRFTVRSFCLLALALAYTSGAQGQSPAGLPSADAVIAKHMQAIGGRDALLNLTSRVASGVLEQDGLPEIRFELVAKAPDKFYFRLSLPDNGEVIQAYDGVTAWDGAPETGVRVLAGSARAHRIRNATFQRELRMQELYTSLKTVGRDRIGALEVYVVEGTVKEGPPERLYFAADNGLLLRRDTKFDSDGQPVEFSTYYEDYRAVDGVLLPYALRRAGPDGTFTLRFRDIRHNLPVDDTLFSKPAGN